MRVMTDDLFDDACKIIGSYFLGTDVEYYYIVKYSNDELATIFEEIADNIRKSSYLEKLKNGESLLIPKEEKEKLIYEIKKLNRPFIFSDKQGEITLKI